MVLKSSNCNRNSGNTMRVRYFKEQWAWKERQWKYVNKLVRNIPLKAEKGKDWDIDVAQCYINDGGLECHQLNPNSYHSLTYSLNKRKRWSLVNTFADAMSNQDLADEEFKVTLVERSDHVSEGGLSPRNLRANVTAYYDSHAGRCCLKPRNKFSFLTELLKKGKDLSRIKEKKIRKQKKSFHNQHFRGVQRKLKTVPRNKINERQVDNDDASKKEIRYEIAVPVCGGVYRVDSPYKGYLPTEESRTFRGEKRKMLTWYFTDALRPGLATAHKSGVLKTQMHSEDLCTNAETDTREDEIDIPKEYKAPNLQKFSIVDFLTLASSASCANQQRKSFAKKSHTSVTAVNPASSLQTKKYGKGSAIFMHCSDTSSDASAQDSKASGDDGDSDLESPAGGLFEPSVLSTNTWNMEAEILKFEENISLCELSESELNQEHLEKKYEGSFEVGCCVPFTVAFSLQKAMSQINVGSENLHGKDADSAGDWCLLCQAAPPTQHKNHEFKNTKLFNIYLHSSAEEDLVKYANTQLRNVLKLENNADKVLLLDDLLLWTWDIVIHLTAHREKKANKIVLKTQYLEDFVPLQKFGGHASVCSVPQAYLLTQDQSQQVHRKIDNIQISLDVDYLENMCSICLASIEDTGNEDCLFFMFLTMWNCGHSFCRRCWQNHLTTCILSGQTSLTCMEYKCVAEVDCVTLLSLVPHHVYLKWQQLMQSVTVERSGRWKWCPNARCGRVAKHCHLPSCSPSASDHLRGLPVACECQHHWCLDCGEQAHWPLCCRQFISYNKMLQQYGNKEGSKTEDVMITWVKVKRCPQCAYPIEKNGGCSHMKCIRCYKEFCWTCKSDWYSHMSGTWQGCNDRGEETLELDNSKVYPLPIQCYKQAVTHRFFWKQVEKTWHQTLIDLNNNLVCKMKAKELDHSAVSVVLEVLKFLKQGYILLELGNILLSDTARSNKAAKGLRGRLTILEFSCNRFTERLKKPKIQILKDMAWFQKNLVYGSKVIHQVCYSARELRQLMKSPTQQWLLQRDHEEFVNYR